MWIEAKIYFSLYFKDNLLVPSKANGAWKKRILDLITDCRDKLIPFAMSPGGPKKVAGLLIGCEKLNTEAIAPGLHNPSAAEIDGFLQAEMKKLLPAGWLIQHVPPREGWRQKNTRFEQIINVSRALCLVPSDDMNFNI